MSEGPRPASDLPPAAASEAWPPAAASLAGGPSRRGFIQAAAGAGLGSLAMLAGCRSESAHVSAGLAAGDGRPLRAAFSNAGLQSTWCALGKTTAELWGRLLNVEVEWFDGEFDQRKQRDKIDLLVDEPWDFVCLQAVQIDTLAKPVSLLKKNGVPVISMDVHIVAPEKMRDAGVWTHVSADQEFMGESSSRYMMKAIGGRGTVIHIGGLSAHTGAQGRARGFEKALADFPDVKVVDGGIRWCDWQKDKALNAFTAIINQYDTPLAGAFFHSDDMALACAPAIKNTIHKDMVITAVDGQKEGLEGIRSGLLAASTVNPVCLIHKTALTVGQFLVRNQEAIGEVPEEIVTPGPLVSRDSGNLEAMLYLADPRHCLV